MFVVGVGPDGTGLYRISEEEASPAGRKADPKADGKAAAAPISRKHVNLLIKFTGEMGEHGPHVPRLGPDGLIYVLTGDHTRPERPKTRRAPIIITTKGI